MTTNGSGSAERQEWLEKGVKLLRPWFKDVGYPVPDNVRVSVGWPRGAHGRGRAIGQCWYAEGSDDKHHEIFVSPELGNSNRKGFDKKANAVRVLGVLAHELAHSVAGPKAKHKKPFKEVATAVGLEGKMTATTEGPIFVEQALKIIDKIGTFPAGKLNAIQLEKQTTRMIKCECAECGYVARTSRKWIKESGAPHCAVKAHGRMGTDYEPEEDEE
jgi:hypothetical protein